MRSHSLAPVASKKFGLEVLEARPDIQVLFTDVNMPGSLDGLALAEIVQVRWPAIRILIGSGRIRAGSAALPSGARFMEKPYLPGALTEAVWALVQEQREGLMPGTPQRCHEAVANVRYRTPIT